MVENFVDFFPRSPTAKSNNIKEEMFLKHFSC